MKSRLCALGLAAGLAAAGGLATSCSQPCSELEDVCKSCKDNQTKQECNQVLQADDKSSCSQYIEPFQAAGCK